MIGLLPGAALRRVVPLLALALAAFAAGAWFSAQIKDRQIADLHAAQAVAVATAERAARAALAAAQTRGDALSTRLEAANRAALRRQETLDDALRRATTGRPCLDHNALRLLDGAPGLRVAAPVPAAAGSPAAADAGVATDTDLGRWIGRAGQQYDECRRRLGALIEWHGSAGTGDAP